VHGWVVFHAMNDAARIGSAGVAVALLLSCGSGEDRRPAPAPASPTVESPAPVAPPEPPARDRERDIHGLTVKVNDDDTILVRGTDRWGASIDTTYETAVFLRDALPSLERSITAEQAAGLRAVLDEIQGAE
jgi:hypothetical protein